MSNGLRKSLECFKSPKFEILELHWSTESGITKYLRTVEMSAPAVKLVTVCVKEGKNIVGALLQGGAVLDITAGLKRSGLLKSIPFATSLHNMHMLDFLRAIETRPDVLESLRGKILQGSFHNSDVIHANAFKLLAPIIPDRNVFCIGKNYSDHIDEINKVNAQKATTAASGQGQVTPAENITVPVIFTKAPQTIIGHGAGIQCHASITKWLDYEVELAVIIGKTCRDVSEKDAMSKVFGYTIGNDVTARDVQKKHMQWFKGKSLDTFCPLGPAISLASDIDASNLRIQTWVNGELRQDSSTSSMIFKIPRLISELSKGFTLLPGDVLLTGTPSGVGYAMQPPQVLKVGDKVRMEIQGLGTLENVIIP